MFTGINPSLVQEPFSVTSNSVGEGNGSTESREKFVSQLCLSEKVELLRRLKVSTRDCLQDSYAIIFGFLVETGRQGAKAMND